MGPHAFAICWLAGLQYQDMVREVTQQPLTAGTETKARRRPLTSFVTNVAAFARTLLRRPRPGWRSNPRRCSGAH